jgi:ADP-ribosyltransferase exoenzyme
VLTALRHPSAVPHVGCTVCDAAQRGDPTETADLRRRWKIYADIRWRRTRAQLRAAIATQNILGLGTQTTSLSLSIGGLPADEKIRAFQSWTDQTLNRLVTENDAAWLDPLLAASYARAVRRATRLSSSAERPPAAAEAVAAIQQLALAELQGVVEAVSQQIVRAGADAVLASWTTRELLTRCYAVIEKVGVTRTRALVEALTIKAFTNGTLDQFTVAGVKKVGVLPERLKSPGVPSKDGATVVPFMRDARRGTGPGSRLSKTRRPSATTIGRITRSARAVEELGQVNVLTAGDDLVCPICEGIAEDGPYDIDEARSLIPAHPWCRCAFVPAEDARFAGDVRDDFNPSEERVPKGQPGGGQWTKTGAGESPEDVKKELDKSVAGMSAERVRARKLMKNATPEERKALQQRVIDSFKKQHDKFEASGKSDKAAELKGKIASYSKKYGLENPIKGPSSVVEANKGYTPKEIAGGKELMHSAGVTYSPEETAQFNDLYKVAGESAKGYTLRAKQVIARDNLEGISHGELAHVVAYTGSAYRETNAALRSGVMSEDRWNHVNALNNAIEKLPTYSGTVYRKADLTSGTAAMYKKGMIVEERGFTSTSKNYGTWSGSYRFTIVSKTGRDVSRISSHSSEAEVLFRSGTRFKVTGVNGNVIDMEEVSGR